MFTWKTKKLGEVIKLEYGKPLPKTERGSDGKYPVYGANGIKSWSDSFYYDKATIIVGRKGSAGEINFTKKKFWPLDVTYFVKFDDNKYNLKFLYNLLDILELTKLAKGVKPGINRNDVYDIDVKIPPLSEQKRIVSKLDELFEQLEKAKENTKKNLANAKEVFKASLENTMLNKDEGETEYSLEEICTFRGGGTPSKEVNKYWQGDIPWVSPKDMKSKLILDTIDHISYEAIKESSTTLIPKNAILLVVRSGILSHTIPLAITGRDVTINQDIKALLPKSSHATSEFLYYVILGASKILLSKVNKGATVHRLQSDFLKNLKVHLPSLSEQKSIVKKLDQLSEQTKKLEEIYTKKLKNIEELKKSILQQAFSGKL